MATNGTPDPIKTPFPASLVELIIRGLPNFLGLLVAVYLMYRVVEGQAAYNKVLTDLLLRACGQ